VIDQSTPAAFHRTVAGRLTELVRGATDWDAPAPVAGWTAGDVSGTWSSGSRGSWRRGPG